MSLRKLGRAPLGATAAISGAASLLSTIATNLLAEATKQAVGGGLVAVAWTTAALALLSFLFWAIGKRSSRSAGEVDAASEPQGGLGVVLSLPSRDRPSSGQLTAALRQAEQQHAVYEHIDQELPTSVADRSAVVRNAAEKFHGTVNHRWSAAKAGPVALYLVSPLPESFILGRHMRYPARPVVVMQSARTNDRSDTYYAAVELGERLHSPLSTAEKEHAESLLCTDTRVFESSPPEAPIALIVELSGHQSRVEEAVQAARTGESERYEIRSTEQCRAALVISTRSGGLSEDKKAFELAVRYLVEHWDAWVSDRGPAEDQLLFASAPAGLVTALGYVFAHDPLRPIRHVSPSFTGSTDSDKHLT